MTIYPSDCLICSNNHQPLHIAVHSRSNQTHLGIFTSPGGESISPQVSKSVSQSVRLSRWSTPTRQSNYQSTPTRLTSYSLVNPPQYFHESARSCTTFGTAVHRSPTATATLPGGLLGLRAQEPDRGPTRACGSRTRARQPNHACDTPAKTRERERRKKRSKELIIELIIVSKKRDLRKWIAPDRITFGPCVRQTLQLRLQTSEWRSRRPSEQLSGCRQRRYNHCSSQLQRNCSIDPPRIQTRAYCSSSPIDLVNLDGQSWLSAKRQRKRGCELFWRVESRSESNNCIILMMHDV